MVTLWTEFSVSFCLETMMDGFYVPLASLVVAGSITILPLNTTFPPLFFHPLIDTNSPL